MTDPAIFTPPSIPAVWSEIADCWVIRDTGPTPIPILIARAVRRVIGWLIVIVLTWGGLGAFLYGLARLLGAI